VSFCQFPPSGRRIGSRPSQAAACDLNIIDAAKRWDLDRTLEIAMDALRLPPPDADVTKLSGGERRRLALCKIQTRTQDPTLDQLVPAWRPDELSLAGNAF
jgi:hypothetical protein